MSGYGQRLAEAGMGLLIGDVGIGAYAECSMSGCTSVVTYEPRARRRVSVEEAEAAITRKGWLRREGRFVCPRCAADISR